MVSKLLLSVKMLGTNVNSSTVLKSKITCHRTNLGVLPCREDPGSNLYLLLERVILNSFLKYLESIKFQDKNFLLGMAKLSTLCLHTAEQGVPLGFWENKKEKSGGMKKWNVTFVCMYVCASM